MNEGTLQPNYAVWIAAKDAWEQVIRFRTLMHGERFGEGVAANPKA